MNDAVAVIVVAHGSAAALPALTASVLPQLRADDALVVVDNASTDGTAELVPSLSDRVLLIANEDNRGFAAGCRQGVEATVAPLLLLLNPDARLEAEALDRLRAAAAEQPDWTAWQAVVMLPDERINTSGGVVHYLGIGWAGQCGEDASALARTPHETAFPSGAAMMIRRTAWEELAGFDDSYFLYGEDLDLGLRSWLAGGRVGVEPRARVIHDYDFDKGAHKWFLLERNRWRTVIATYPRALLIALLPGLLAAELALLVVAARGGWLRAKLAAQRATVLGLRASLRRRAIVQRTRRIGAREFASHLTASLDTSIVGLPPALARAQRAHWRVVTRLLR